MNDRIAIIAHQMALVSILSFFAAMSQLGLANDFIFKVSRIHGLVTFAESLSHSDSGSRSLERYFQQSRYNTAETQSLIRAYDEVRKVLVYGWDSSGYPTRRPMGQNLADVFFIQSAFSEDLTDFKQRTLGLIPIPDHNRYFEVLNQLAPIYDDLIWEPHIKQLQEYQHKLQAMATEWKFMSLFRKAQTFYGASWSNDTPAYISLYPIPGDGQHTVAKSVLSFESVGVAFDDDYAGRLGVVFHELSHSLYGAQPLVLQHKLEEYFTESTSRHATLAYDFINEALATALGNGWFYKVATGKADKNPWYDHRYIDGFAKVIYPLVETYVTTGKTMDRPFVDQAPL